ncbi:hypothetical protein LguiA_015267 [Lonicera macranthoides]
MAAAASSSPALSNNSTDTTPSSASNAAVSSSFLPNTTTTNSSKNLRGLNKPKCIKCGNVARSRCPYQSCKSCCAKAQNPCHIHVLKGTSTFPDKASSAGSPLFDQQSTEASPSGSSLRVATLRQLSNNFAQFNNLQTPVRSKKPLTRKDAAVINEWRFSKLKEYRERNIEAENEAFDRYMQNVTLMEEVFSVNSTPEEPCNRRFPISSPKPTSAEQNTEPVAAGLLELKLRSNSTRTENFRKRIQHIVDRGLKKLRKLESNGGVSELTEQKKERTVALSELIDKLNKARNEEDLKLCMEMKARLFNKTLEPNGLEPKDIEASKEPSGKIDISPQARLRYSPPKWCSTTGIDQEALSSIDAHFSSLEQIESL